jgi:hypothetical protein
LKLISKIILELPDAFLQIVLKILIKNFAGTTTILLLTKKFMGLNTTKYKKPCSEVTLENEKALLR